MNPAAQVPAETARPQAPSESLAAWGVLLTGLVCCVRLALYVHRCAVDVLSADQWDYLNPLFRGDSLSGSFLYQHGPHRLGLGGLVDRLLFPLSAWDNRLCSWFCALVLALSACVALALVRRVRGRLLWRDALIPLAFINPMHWESIVLTPGATAAFLPLLLVLLTAHAWLLRNELLRGLVLAALLSLSLFTGYGFCHFFVGTGLLALCLGTGGLASLRRQLPGLALLALALVLFRHGLTWSPAVAGWRFPMPEWWDYSTFVMLMNGRLLGSDYFSITAYATGGTLTVLLLWLLSRGLRRLFQDIDRQAAVRVQVWLAGCSLGYAAFVAIGRLPTGLQAAFLWRYSTLLLPGLVALLLLEELVPTLNPLLSRFASLLLLLVGLRMWWDFSPERYGTINQQGKTAWVRSYLVHHDLARANAESECVLYPPDPVSPNLAAKLLWLEERRLSFFSHPADFAEQGTPAPRP